MPGTEQEDTFSLLRCTYCSPATKPGVMNTATHTHKYKIHLYCPPGHKQRKPTEILQAGTRVGSVPSLQSHKLCQCQLLPRFTLPRPHSHRRSVSAGKRCNMHFPKHCSHAWHLPTYSFPPPYGAATAPHRCISNKVFLHRPSLTITTH